MERLRDIPADARLLYEYSETHSSSFPVGAIAKLAADKISQLESQKADTLAALNHVRAFVAEELSVRIDSGTLGGDLATADDMESAVIADARDTLAVIDAAIKKAQGAAS